MAEFATVDELESRWRPLTADEKERASALLSDASAVISAGLAGSGLSADDVDGGILRMVACSAVKRAMLAPADRPPVTQGSMTGGPYSESWTFANPSGDLYLTAAERRLLGMGRPRIGFCGIGSGS